MLGRRARILAKLVNRNFFFFFYVAIACWFCLGFTFKVYYLKIKWDLISGI